MKTTDNISCELRKVEKEVDNYYKSNPLIKLPFATAAWYLLAFGEETMLKAYGEGIGAQYNSMISDNLINELKYPLYWIYCTCESGGKVPSAFNANFFQVSREFFELGQEYIGFVAAYTSANRGWFELKLKGSIIQPTTDIFTGIEYKSYNSLIKPQKLQKASSSINIDRTLLDTIGHFLRVKEDRFLFNPNPKIVSEAIMVHQPRFETLFSLPSEWQFSHYSLKEFRGVFETIYALAYLHWVARTIAIKKGCGALGYADSIYVPTCEELLRRVVRYSGLPEAKVLSVFEDLTYGNRNISHPDPALQPLIKLNSDRYAIMPHLWLCSSAERNLTVLLNKLPSEKRIYQKLVHKKEGFMRQRFTDNLSDKGFRFVNRSVPNLPDIDLAIIRDSEKACLLLELKWFIDPAEMREIIEKSEELEKGISQVIKLKQAFSENHKPLLERLNVDSSYSFEGVVVSENWIGHAEVQNPKIPIIRADHLLAKLKGTDSLQSTIEWLKDRKYLPKEGEHFKIHRFTHRIGRYRLKWYGIKPLIEDAFFPL